MLTIVRYIADVCILAVAKVSNDRRRHGPQGHAARPMAKRDGQHGCQGEQKHHRGDALLRRYAHAVARRRGGSAVRETTLPSKTCNTTIMERNVKSPTITWAVFFAVTKMQCLIMMCGIALFRHSSEAVEHYVTSLTFMLTPRALSILILI